MRHGIADLMRTKEELGPRVLLALAEESSPFDHLRNRAIRDRIISADCRMKVAILARRAKEAS